MQFCTNCSVLHRFMRLQHRTAESVLISVSWLVCDLTISVVNFIVFLSRCRFLQCSQFPFSSTEITRIAATVTSSPLRSYRSHDWSRLEPTTAEDCRLVSADEFPRRLSAITLTEILELFFPLQTLLHL